MGRKVHPGMIIGDLKIHSFSHHTENTHHLVPWWQCECSCGKLIVVSRHWLSARIKFGRAVSCGHEEWEWPDCNLSELDFAYLAGLTDSEGTIGIYHLWTTQAGYESYAPFFVIGMTSELPNQIHRQTGIGTLCVRPSQAAEWMPTQIWQLCQKDIKKLIPRLLPYLILKQEQAILVKKYIEMSAQPCRITYRQSPGYIDAVSQIHNQLSAINERGVMHHFNGALPEYKNRSTRMAYSAGFVDGDGCFSISRPQVPIGTPRYQPRLGIDICHDGLFAIRSLFDNIGMIRLRKARSSSRAPTYCWKMNRTCLQEILPSLVPHLRLKRQQADIIQELLRLYGRHNFGRGADAAERLYLQMRELNRRGL